MALIDSPYLAIPGKKIRLADWPTDDTGEFADKAEAKAASGKNLKKLDELQQVLYAQAKHAVLIVFQAMDGGGKDGAVRHVLGRVNPQGCIVTSFKVPTVEESKHDFLWRIHKAAPERGMIGVFNRSHYESVLVERVRKLAPREVWSGRYDHINAFEKLLADEGTTILKFFLHISWEEQKRRMEARLDDPTKNWKFSPADLKERRRWGDYMAAYEDCLRKCSTKHAPWYIVPADHKWYRDWVISDTIVQTIKKLKLEYPPPMKDADKYHVK
jgi:PPK2 family polyphosphate:nucleotide phosphotransferase